MFFSMLSNVAKVVNVANCSGTSTYNYVLTYTTLSLTQNDVTTSLLGLELSCPCFPNICYSSILQSHYECGSATLFDLQTELSSNKTIQTYHFVLRPITWWIIKKSCFTFDFDSAFKLLSIMLSWDFVFIILLKSNYT